MVTDMETGKQTIQMRVADGVSERKAWRPGMSTEWQVKSKRPAEPTQRPESRQRRRLGQDRRGRTSKAGTALLQYHTRICCRPDCHNKSLLHKA